VKVLITGGAGFIGSHLGNPRFRYVRDSVLNSGILEGLIPWCDLVYHFAAVVGVEHYVADPYQVLNVNVNGTQTVLNVAFKSRKKVVFSSTSEVYGRSLKSPFSEDGERVLGSTRIDRWCYSTSKAVGEHFCFAYHKLGLPVILLRYFNIYGPRLDQMDMGRVITIFLGQLMRGAPVTVIGSGEQTRCFTYVDDAIRATVAAGVTDEAVGRVINVGSNEEVTIRELAELMIRLSGSTSTLKFVTEKSVYGPSYEDIPRRVPDVRLMEELLHERAEISLKEGLGRTLAWFRNVS